MKEIVIKGDTIPEYIRSITDARVQIREHGFDPDDDLVIVSEDEYLFGDDLKVIWTDAPDEPVTDEDLDAYLDAVMAS